jgi:hypothetical protein
MAIAQGQHRRQTVMEDAPLRAQMVDLRMRHLRELVKRNAAPIGPIYMMDDLPTWSMRRRTKRIR